ncbi:MAG TPA: hypothetical protein VGU64_21475 [Terriglobales bacterium]|nr:hypothetical protein [Terriglobales bacterium]
MDRKIMPDVPVWDRSARSAGTFSRDDFVFDRERNVYICPGGVELTSTGNVDQGHIVYTGPAEAPARDVR